jgi:HK97 family phage major capsid protein
MSIKERIQDMAQHAIERKSYERKEHGAVDPAVTALFAEQAKTFEAFKATNDALEKEVKKLGSADVITEEKLGKIGQKLDELGDAIKLSQKHAEEIEAKFNRGGLGGGGSGDAEIKAAADFSALTGHAVTVDDFRDYKKGFDTYIRRGPDGRAPELKALSVGSDPDGGYLVTPDVSGRMVAKIYESSPIRQVASVVSIGTDSLEGPVDNGEAGAGWVGEKATRAETTTPQLGKWIIPVNEVYAEPRATQKVLDDAMIDLEAWLANKVSEKIARVENAAFVAGDGQLKPKGLFSYAFAATTDKAGTRPWGTFEFVGTGTSGAFASTAPADAIYDLVYRLKAGYRNNARFMMTRATVGAIRKFKDTTGQYLWQPALTAGQPQTILGYEVVEGEDVPEIVANSYSIAFGDFAETYQIVDRVGVSVLRDPFTLKGWVKFYTRRRTGGGAVNFESMKFLKFA